MIDIEGDLTPEEAPDPMNVECPLCAAPIGRPCIASSQFGPKHLAKSVHTARVRKARQVTL